MSFKKGPFKYGIFGKQFKDSLFGHEGQDLSFDMLSPEQKEALNSILGGLPGLNAEGMDWIWKMLSGDPEAQEQFDAPIKRQFNEQIIPGIAERFTGMGAQSSSAFQQSLGAAGTSLAERLAAMRGDRAQSALDQLLRYNQIGLGTKTKENAYQPRSGGWLDSILGGLGQAGGAAIGGMFL